MKCFGIGQHPDKHDWRAELHRFYCLFPEWCAHCSYDSCMLWQVLWWVVHVEQLSCRQLHFQSQNGSATWCAEAMGYICMGMTTARLVQACTTPMLWPKVPGHSIRASYHRGCKLFCYDNWGQETLLRQRCSRCPHEAHRCVLGWPCPILPYSYPARIWCWWSWWNLHCSCALVQEGANTGTNRSHCRLPCVPRKLQRWPQRQHVAHGEVGSCTLTVARHHKSAWVCVLNRFVDFLDHVPWHRNLPLS